MAKTPKHPFPEPGKRYGKLTVIRVMPPGPKHRKIECVCDCGKNAMPRLDHLQAGASKSCGCERNRKSGDRARRHGESGTPLHRVWVGIKNRTSHQGSSVWKYYGGRGINMCNEWKEYESFRDWAIENGWRKGLVIDRIDVDGDYEPNNCRWVSFKVNARNKRDNHRVKAFGEEKTLIEWSEDERCSVKYGTLWARLNRGWSFEDSLLRPLGGKA